MYSNSKKKIISFFVFILIAIFVFNWYSGGVITNKFVEFFAKYTTHSNQVTDKYLQNKYKLQMLEYENKILKRFIKNTQSTNGSTFEKELALQVKTPGKDLYGFMYVYLPSDDGVFVDDLLVDSYGFAIGKIESIKNKIAKVKIFSAPGTSMNAITQNGVASRLSGIGSSSFVLKLPTGFSAKEGELIFLPESIGFPVAIVYTKSKTGNIGAFVSYLARIPKNIDSQTHFFVLKGSGVLNLQDINNNNKDANKNE